MQKKIIIMLVLITALVHGTDTAVFAVSSATATATPQSNKAQLEDLKERLATKVAALRDVVKRAVYGTVTSVSISSATLETKTKTMKVELNDDVKVAQILVGKRTQLTVDDISKNDPITVFGTYDATLDLLKAQFIFIESKTSYEHAAGAVTDIDRTQFTLTIRTSGGQSIVVDVEKSTKATQWDKTNGIVKGGFSKISIGDTVHIVGTLVPKKENRISALRVLDLGNLTGAPTPATILSPTPEASATATPKSSPKATPKPTATPTP